jgi:hypothetical protein
MREEEPSVPSMRRVWRSLLPWFGSSWPWSIIPGVLAFPKNHREFHHPNWWISSSFFLPNCCFVLIGFVCGSALMVTKTDRHLSIPLYQSAKICRWGTYTFLPSDMLQRYTSIKHMYFVPPPIPGVQSPTPRRPIARIDRTIGQIPPHDPGYYPALPPRTVDFAMHWIHTATGLSKSIIDVRLAIFPGQK